VQVGRANLRVLAVGTLDGFLGQAGSTVEQRYGAQPEVLLDPGSPGSITVATAT
jgi:hypothetical protein